FFFFSSRRRHTRFSRDWSSDVCSSDLAAAGTHFKHWERARVNAQIAGDAAVNVETANVAAFSLEMGPGGCPLDGSRKPVVTIDRSEERRVGKGCRCRWTKEGE